MVEKIKLDWVVVRRAPVQRLESSDGIDLAADDAKGPLAVSPVNIATDAMTHDEAREQSAAEDTIDLAPALPICLITATPDAAATEIPEVAWGLAAVHADKSPYDGAGVKVAILDTGIDEKYADLEAFKNLKFEVRNFVQGESEHDLDGHGTHCAGTILGRDVDGHRIGVARGISDVFIGKVIGENGGRTENIVNAIQAAAAWGADVISMSLGMDFPAYRERLVQKFGLDARQATSMALEGYLQNVRMFDRLSTALRGEPGLIKGTVVVAASGNESNAPAFTIHASPPSNAEGFLSVAALAQDGALASFSNVGASVAAPGVGIWSAKRGGGLQSKSGTSMATPHVAGIACLWAQKLKMAAAWKKYPGADDTQARAKAATMQVDSARVVDAVKASCAALAPKISDADVLWGAPQAPSE